MLQFTVVRENNRSVTSLDTEIIRLDNNTIVTECYQTRTNSER